MRDLAGAYDSIANVGLELTRSLCDADVDTRRNCRSSQKAKAMMPPMPPATWAWLSDARSGGEIVCIMEFSH